MCLFQQIQCVVGKDGWTADVSVEKENSEWMKTVV